MRLILQGGNFMKLLKIKDHQGFYSVDGESFAPINKIDKNDLLKLVDQALEDDATYDEYSEELLKNQAHQIIYKSIYEKLKALSDSKDEFIDESERLYLKEYEKYRPVSS